jgi:hypothetical protein
MTCPRCNVALDSDSCFCDQCGVEVMVCPRCGEPGAKKRCKHDGAELVPARSRRPPGVAPQPEGAVLTLLNHTVGVEHVCRAGDALGRRAGPLADALGAFGGVSGRHAEVRYTPEAGWAVVDVGSTNGTTYDGRTLEPQEPVALRDGGSLVLGKSVELLTRIEPPLEPAPAVQTQPARPQPGTIRV